MQNPAASSFHRKLESSQTTNSLPTGPRVVARGDVLGRQLSEPEAAELPAELAQLADLTAHMLAASERGEWNLVSALESTRYQVLSALAPDVFTDPHPATERILRDALASTDYLNDRACKAREGEQKALRVIRRAQQGVRSYLNQAEAP